MSISLERKRNVAIILWYPRGRINVRKCDWNDLKKFNYKAKVPYVFLSCLQQIQRKKSSYKIYSLITEIFYYKEMYNLIL